MEYWFGKPMGAPFSIPADRQKIWFRGGPEIDAVSVMFARPKKGLPGPLRRKWQNLG